MRYAFIRFPHYCHQQIKTEHQTPLFVLVKESRKALYVSDLSNSEYECGLRLGMPLAHAKAIVPDIAHYLHDDYDFKKSFTTLADRAWCFSPHVAINDFGLLINITGCAHLVGGETAMLNTMTDFFRALGFHTAIAFAPYPMLAKALAHFAPGTITTTGNTKAVIASLPIDALFLDDTSRNALNDLAITTMKDLQRLPRKMLAQRFGLLLVHKLDQLLGVINEPPTYREEDRAFMYREYFSSPIRNHEHLIEVSTQILTKALSELALHHRVLQRFTISFVDIFKKPIDVAIEASTPHNGLDAWLELLRLKTENLRINQGIDAIVLTITQWTKAHALQRSLAQQDDNAIELSFITDKLKSRLGDKAIFNLRVVDNHIPEHAVTKDFSLSLKLPPHRPLPPRPLRLLKKPLPISVIALLPDNPPAKIIWRERTITVLHASGPERIEAPWWTSSQEAPRDYYYIEDERGKRFWIYATGTPKQWFIHGVFA